MEKTPDSDELHTQLEAALKQYAIIAKEFADEKIQCFTSEVAHVKKIDIEFICADNAAHDSIQSALESSLYNNIQCGTHIDCDNLEEQLNSKMGGVAHTALGGIEGNMSEQEVSYREGVADFNGNYQIPVEGEKYLFVSVRYRFSDDKYRYMGMKNGKFRNRGRACQFVDNDLVTFER